MLDQGTLQASQRLQGSLLFRLLVVAGWLLAAGLAHGLGMTLAQRHRAQQRYEDTYTLPPPQWLVAMSLGYREALADLIWVRALIYFGEEIQHRSTTRHVGHYGDAILRLDPRFKQAYRWTALALLYNTGPLTLDNASRAAGYLRRAAERYPDDGELAWDLGATLAYELAPMQTDPARRAAIRAESVEVLLRAARLGAGPPWLTLSNAATLEKLGKTEQAARHLEEMLAHTSDPAVREEITDRLRRLRDEATVQAFSAALHQLEEQWRREYPYLPPSLYLLLAPRQL